jgi:phospholipid/cholesterol/gamma-HCH transport system substrate-binding protein
MESDARYAWVGAGLLLLLAMLAGGLYWLTGGADKAIMKRYLVYFQRQSLEGLQINSAVRMQGVNVGEVVDYAIMPGEAKRVRVTLKIDARTPLLDGVEAVVTRNLVTGLAAVDLDNRVEGGKPLEMVPAGESYPVIKEGVPQLAKVASTLEGLGESSQSTLDRLNALLSERNQRAIAATLLNLEAVTGQLRETLPHLNASLPQLNAALTSAKQAAERIDALALDTSHAVRDSQARFGKVAAEAESTLITSRDTLKSVDGDVRKMSTQLRRSADLAMQEVQATAQSLRLAGDALQNAGRSLADPGRVLYGPSKAELGPGEKK